MFRRTLIALAVASLCSSAWAAVSADEAKQLGNTLTPIGAEKAGSKDGTIPAYTDGLTTLPAGFKKGDGIRPDPFATEKPLYSIDAKSIDKYADRLTEGTKELLKRYPAFRVDVYPTHRTAAISKFVAENTLKNATRAKTTEGGIGLVERLWRRPVPDPEGRPRGDVEPSDALRRLHVPVQGPHLHGGRERQAGAVHRDDQHQPVPVLRPDEDVGRHLTTWSAWITRVRRVARAKASSCTTR